MCSRHRPEEGADSETYSTTGDPDRPHLEHDEPDFVAEATTPEEYREGADQNGGGGDPPMQELPRATRDVVEAYVRQHMPNASPQEIASQVSETMMADGLGRAYHASRWPGGIIDTTRCVRVNKAGAVEPIPYGYDDERPDGYACDCENIAIHLIEVMKAQQAKHDMLASSRIVRAERPLN
jgi:hypothetical protein